MKSVHVIRRPIASRRRHSDSGAELDDFLRDREINVVELTGDSAASTRTALRQAIDGGAVEHVIAVGGDGVVHLAVQELAELDIPLSIQPRGTGNDFAAALGLHEPDPASVLLPPTPVDLLRLRRGDDHQGWVASVAIAGFPAQINARANEMSLPIGQAIYTLATVLELPRFHRQNFQLTLDGEDLTTDAAMLAIGNTCFMGGGMLVCPDATPTDGLLHLTAIEGVGRLGLLRHLASQRGGTADRPEVLRRTGRSIHIAAPVTAIWGDGEPVGSSPVQIDVVPAALRMTRPTLLP